MGEEEQDPSFRKIRNISITLMGCNDCSMVLVPWMQELKVEGASPRYFLICPGCRNGLRIKASEVTLAHWDKKDEENGIMDVGQDSKSE